MAEGTCGIVGFESSKRPLLPVRPAVIEGHLLQIRREREREREREEERRMSALKENDERRANTCSPPVPPSLFRLLSHSPPV